MFTTRAVLHPSLPPCQSKTSPLYHAERAASWLVTMGCALEALMVGAARNVFPFAATALLQQIGPECLDNTCIDFLVRR